MKKLFSMILAGLGALLVNTASAQVTFSPSVFTAIDQVTITVDVTGTPMAGEPEAYLWAFSNAGDAVSNGSWGSSSIVNKMTSAGVNKWRYTFTGVDFYNSTPAALKELGLLLKSKDGSKQTPDYKWFKFDPLIFTATKMRVFPSKVGPDDVVSVNFDQSLATVVNEQRMMPNNVTVVLVNAAGGTVDTKTFPVKKEGTIFIGTFIPTYSFTVPVGTVLDKFRYRFNGTVKNASNVDVTVSTEEVEVPFSKLK